MKRFFRWVLRFVLKMIYAPFLLVSMFRFVFKNRKQIKEGNNPDILSFLDKHFDRIIFVSNKILPVKHNEITDELIDYQNKEVEALEKEFGYKLTREDLIEFEKQMVSEEEYETAAFARDLINKRFGKI